MPRNAKKRPTAAAHSDQSDDEIMQGLAVAVNLFKSRFGATDLVLCLRDLLTALEDAGAE